MSLPPRNLVGQRLQEAAIGVRMEGILGRGTVELGLCYHRHEVMGQRNGDGFPSDGLLMPGAT
jgi:hypothetical protein